MEESLSWGRSRLGCDGCKDPRTLAGWEVKLGTQTVAHICSECASSWRPGDPLPGVRVQDSTHHERLAL